MNSLYLSVVWVVFHEPVLFVEVHLAGDKTCTQLMIGWVHNFLEYARSWAGQEPKAKVQLKSRQISDKSLNFMWAIQLTSLLPVGGYPFAKFRHVYDGFAFHDSKKLFYDYRVS